MVEIVVMVMAAMAEELVAEEERVRASMVEAELLGDVRVWGASAGVGRAVVAAVEVAMVAEHAAAGVMVLA